ncbi:MAG: SUMF1/EgtB/PvdO family nonheme iron enzyme, partial [Planctomycetota bacterium]
DFAPDVDVFGEIHRAHAAFAQLLNQLGQYKLLKKLGEGGMGAVYLAEDVNVGRKVAVKVLSRKHAEDHGFLTRFRREAQATGKLNHANIVCAYTVGEDRGLHYYAMEYCDGDTLDSILKREGFIPWRPAVNVVLQIARGLQHAHDHSIIHRDIKPANIFICKPPGSAGVPPAGAGKMPALPEGFVAKILDLGLSKTIGAESSFYTQTGVALGTPHYISPEQANADKSIDGRTDIYSLGATLYHLVTGATPFQASTPMAIMMKHIKEQLPNPQDLREDIPDGVVQVIQKMMAKAPADRYANCKELLDDLELLNDGKMPSSQAIEEGKSSIALPRLPRRVPMAPRRTTGPQQPIVGQRKREPVGRFAESPGRVGNSPHAPGEPATRPTAKYIAMGVGALVLIAALGLGAKRGLFSLPSPSGGESGVSAHAAIEKQEAEAARLGDEKRKAEAAAKAQAAPPVAPAPKAETAQVEPKAGETPVVQTQTPAGLAGGAGELLLFEDFEKLNLQQLPTGWTLNDPTGAISIVDEPGRGKVLKISNKGGSYARLSIPLDPAKVRDHTVRISAWAKFPGSYTPHPNPALYWARPKFQLTFKDKEGKDHYPCGYELAPNKPDWQIYKNPGKIDKEAQSVTVWLSVDLVAAEAFFDDLCVELVPDLNSPPQRPKPVAGNAAGGGPAAGVVYLSDLPEQEVQVLNYKGRTPWAKNGGAGEYPIVVNKVPSPKGLFMHPANESPSHVAYALDGKYQTFQASAAINDSAENKTGTALTFKVVGDGRLLWASQPTKETGKAQDCRVDVGGVQKLELLVECPGHDEFAHAVWVEPRLTPVGAMPAQNNVLIFEDFEKLNLQQLAAERPGWKLRDARNFSIVDEPGRGKVLKVSTLGGGLAEFTIGLDPAKVRGHTVRISAWVKFPGSFTPVPTVNYAHPLINMVVIDKEGKPQYLCGLALKPNQPEWQMYQDHAKVDQDAQSVVVNLAIYVVAAEVFFDDVCVEVDPDLNSPPPRRTPEAMPAVQAGPSDLLPPGLVAKYYEHSGPAMALNDTTPKSLDTCVVQNVNIKTKSDLKAAFGREEHLGVRFLGAVKIPKDGEYTFYVRCDDGAILHVGNVLTVDNDGSHAMTEESGAAQFKAGLCPFRLSYYQGTGEAGVIASWSGPNLPKEVIPPSAFCHQPEQQSAIPGLDPAALAALPKTQALDLGGGVKMDFVLVSPGEFTMGSNDGPDEEKPAHKVKISKPFYIAKSETTVAQFRAFAEAVKYQTDAERVGRGQTLVGHEWKEELGVNWRKPGFPQDDTHPACLISWNDAQQFCHWASSVAQLAKLRYSVRLPTEAEWEYAARGPQSPQFPWGDKWEGPVANVGDASLRRTGFDMRWGEIKEDDGFPFTAPVGSYKNGVSWCGAYDMVGNVWEWVQDLFSDNYSYLHAPTVDPQAFGTGTEHVLRGGSWTNGRLADCRVSTRHKSGPGLRSASVGFRCVLDLSPASAPPVVQSATTNSKPETPPAQAVPADVAAYAKEHGLQPAMSLDLGGGVKLELVLIPPGKFFMGSPVAEPGRPDDGREDPQHEVTISSPFYMGRHDVSVAQFRRFVDTRKYETRADKLGGNCLVKGEWKLIPGVTWKTPNFQQEDSQPVCLVMWRDAEEFCKWAATFNGLANMSVRLPTEAEWEYACRAKTTTRFNTGDTDRDFSRAAWFKGNSGGKTHPVGQIAPNAWGLYDMHGNVNQWCKDRWQRDYYKESPRADPPGPNAGDNHVIRGGCFNDDSKNCRSARRDCKSPLYRGTDIGFRVVIGAGR